MVDFAAKTDVGIRGGENEDTIGWDEERRIWFVADGMGGHANGKVASELAKATLLAADPDKGTDLQLIDAHKAIAAAADSDSALEGMGSTIVVARILGRSAEITWVGDSRAYLWRQGELRRLSRDHSFLEALRAQNLLSEEQIQADPRANLVTQTLGLGDPIPSITETPLLDGDRILLCSDGLTSELNDSEIAETLAVNAQRSVDVAVDDLIERALTRGASDNTSVIIVEYRGARTIALLRRVITSPWFAVVAGAVFAVLVATALWAATD